jgi:hypothetical protein
MSREQTLQEAEAGFVRHLTERARGQHITIDETRWQHLANSDTPELTVVSQRKAYIMSLPCQDLTDPHRAAARQQVIRVLLRAIKGNSSVERGGKREEP